MVAVIVLAILGCNAGTFVRKCVTLLTNSIGLEKESAVSLVDASRQNALLTRMH
jgi:hypothetical protein